MLEIDEYGVVKNCYESAMWVSNEVHQGRTVAISLCAGEGTMFNMTFVPLTKAVPSGVMFQDGSQRGLQINIDRIASYALSWTSMPREWSYISEKWSIPQADAEALLPFFNTVLSGTNCFVKPAKCYLCGKVKPVGSMLDVLVSEDGDGSTVKAPFCEDCAPAE